jgi:hypothetical protein
MIFVFLASFEKNFKNTKNKFDDKILDSKIFPKLYNRFQAPLVHDLDLLVDNGVSVHAYYFTYSGTMTLMEMFRLTPFQLVMNLSARHFGSKMYQKELGACHGDDLLYLFPFAVPGFPKCLKTESDQVGTFVTAFN